MLGAAVLAGWILDISVAKSIMAGWRVMVPVSAASFLLIGVSLALASKHAPVAAVVALLALIPPLLTVLEYLTGTRTGIENWFGVAFESSSPVAGRMSPMASVCLVTLVTSLLLVTIGGPRAFTWARVASGSTLMTSWLAILALAFDAERIIDVPRFPNMALLTIALLAIASWGALSLTFDRDDFTNATGAPAHRGALLAALAFVAPLILGVIRDAIGERLPQQLVTALAVLLFTVTVTAIIWQYASRMAALRKDRERALAELERRVNERTSELARSNEELRRSEDRLRDADRRKDEFLATLAHELRNPLAPIRNAAAVLRSDHVTTREQAQARVILDRQVSHMVRLIDDLLDVSRITAGKLPLLKARRQLSDIINLAMATVQPQLDEARHRVTVVMPEEAVVVEGDEARLSQVFANLLHNACKYTEPGGEILLAVSQPDEAEVSIAVRDNGIGIPAEFLPRLFEKFSQVAPALERSKGGLGLGLSLVHGIVTLHGGRVEARSQGEGRGSEFVVHLPVAERSSLRRVSAPEDPVHAPPVCRRVLVVDDNVDSADAMAMLLRAYGHHVETANDGEEALDLAERIRPDAVLLDIGMPKLNGFEVCQRLRARPWASTTLIVAQTGWGQSQDRQRTQDSGFDKHLTKPVDPDEVHELLLSLRAV